MSNSAPLAALPLLSLRRAKPLLGTLVDISVEAAGAARAQHAIDAAFAEISVVHRLMSFHETGSDLSRLNRAQPGALVPVDPRTVEVLRWAEALRAESGGAFDCAVADTLIALGLLPPVQPAQDNETGRAASGQLMVARGAALLDLGGIAKGYAVDRAIEVLRGFGVASALVNAGGDLRHFGRKAATVHLRDPADPSRLVACIAVRDMALASSASNGLWHAAAMPTDRLSALIDARHRTPLAAAAGASVVAPHCMMADALAKVALVTGNRRHPMLSTYGAKIVLYRSAGRAPA
jgi:thiamine biosynthesis lipoprotein